MSAQADMNAQAANGPVMCVVGARPNFMKMAPILRALAGHTPPLPALPRVNQSNKLCRIDFTLYSRVDLRMDLKVLPPYNQHRAHSL